MLRYLTAGESHGPALTAIIEGLPAGLAVSEDYVNRQLARRQGGYGRGGRMKIEQDRARFLAGIRGGLTLGTPLALQIENRDWSNWQEVMDPGSGARLDQRVVIRPRPGHADLCGTLKYGHRDIRNVLERASARETAARVAVGSVARRLLEELGIEIIGHVVRIGSASAPELVEFFKEPENPSVPSVFASKQAGGVESGPSPGFNFHRLRSVLDASPVYCANPEAGEAMMREIDRARENGDSLGGVFEIRAYGLPPGLGSYAQWDRRLDGRLAGALMSIQAIKGVEVGLGFAGAALPGSQVHDEIFYSRERGFYRRTNRAGGLEGGVTNGEPLVVRAAMKPIPTLHKPLRSVDLVSKEPFEASVERSDVCAVPAACVVGEAAVAWELAVACLEKFGGDTLEEMKKNYQNYLDYLRNRIC